MGKKKYTTEEASKIFAKHGLTLDKSENYINNKTPMLAYTEEGYKLLGCLDRVIAGNTPKVFHSNNPYTIWNISVWINTNVKGYLLKSKEYIRHDSKLSFICQYGHEFPMSWNDFKGGHRCSMCFNEKRSSIVSGSNHWNWQGGITEDNQKTKNSKEYRKWRELVFQRDSYTCQCCNHRNGNGKRIVLNAHHLDGYGWCAEKRTDVNNGVTLCLKCHKKFHNIYGKGQNTKEQYLEFIYNYTYHK